MPLCTHMNTPKVTPKDFFLWAGAMIALYSSVFAFIALLFQYINYAYPDPLQNYYYSDPFSGSMRFAMATLIVMVPVAILIMRYIRKDIASVPAKEDLWIRRWALVLTVFIAGFAAIGDLITLINYFLGGDITTRFVLKVIVLLFVAAGVFFHFLADLRGYWTANPGRARTVAYVTGIVVVGAIISGFFIMGSPAQVRLYRFDSQKVSDLQSIQYQIINFYQQKEKLPANLDELADPLSGWMMPKEAQGGAYRYEKTANLSFKLCATFNAETQKNQVAISEPVMYGVEGENWQHSAGEVCFDRTIDPERYPPYTKSAPIR